MNINYDAFVKSRLAPESRTPNSIGLTVLLGDAVGGKMIDLKNLINKESKFISLRQIFEEIARKTELKDTHEIADLLIKIRITDSCTAFDQYKTFDGQPLRLYNDYNNFTHSKFDIKLLNLAGREAVLDNDKELDNFALYKDDFYYSFEKETTIDLEADEIPSIILEVNESNQYKNGGHIILDDEDKELAAEDYYKRKFKFIRWSYWFEKPMIACHDAVLLSLGLDPENIDYTKRKWATDLKSNDRIELDERILNFKQLIGPEKLFVSDVDGDLKTLVSLKKVAKYLYKRKCDMPQQLLEFINKSVETDNHQSTTPYTVEQYDSLLHENEQLKEKIKKLESLSSSIPAEVEADNLLGLIFDETALYRYAPDLVYAIQLWKSIYLDNPKTDSHNNKANTWIKNNTPYSGEQEDTATRRLREIATPFQDFHPSRKKSLENK